MRADVAASGAVLALQGPQIVREPGFALLTRLATCLAGWAEPWRAAA